MLTGVSKSPWFCKKSPFIGLSQQNLNAVWFCQKTPRHAGGPGGTPKSVH